MKKKNWGGRRAGAGAPRGNLNAVRVGYRSAQLENLYQLGIHSGRVYLALDRLVGDIHRERVRRERVRLGYPPDPPDPIP
jgi:hypothetical protein